MEKLKNVLVGVDFEEDGKSLTAGARAAARQALWLAGRTGARVDFLYSSHHGAEASRAPVVEPDPTEVRALLAELGRGGDLILSAERAWIALARRVLDGESDLVVIGKRNDDSRLANRLIGGVALATLHRCPGPVWVVRPDHQDLREILAATDLSPVGDRAVEYAAFLARAVGAPLDVVHAWQIPMDLQLSAGRISEEEFADRRRTIAMAARDHVRALPAVAEMGEDAHVMLACGPPSSVILDAVKEKQPGLVVMGTISRRGIAGVLVGNTAERLLYRLDTSILAVKPDDFECPLT